MLWHLSSRSLTWTDGRCASQAVIDCKPESKYQGRLVYVKTIAHALNVAVTELEGLKIHDGAAVATCKRAFGREQFDKLDALSSSDLPLETRLPKLGEIDDLLKNANEVLNAACKAEQFRCKSCEGKQAVAAIYARFAEASTKHRSADETAVLEY